MLHVPAAAQMMCVCLCRCMEKPPFNQGRSWECHVRSMPWPRAGAVDPTALPGVLLIGSPAVNQTRPARAKGKKNTFRGQTRRPLPPRMF